MIRLALRLTLTGGREAVVRLVTIAAAVTIGVGLLLGVLAGLNAVNKQNIRYAWLSTGRSHTATASSSGTDPVWWDMREDYVGGLPVARVDVAVTGSHSPVPPGMSRLPGPGEYFASPALEEQLKKMPADQFADRFPGVLAGTIGDAGLPGPDTMIIVVGHTPAEMANAPDVAKVTTIAGTAPGSCPDCVAGIRAAGLDLILAVVAGALLFPVLIFIGTATRLSAARREQRFAAMRLVGATPRQISVIATVESTIATAIGAVLGFGLFAAIRSPLSAIPFTGYRFFTGDLYLNWWNVLLALVGVPLAAAVAAWLALRRVQVSPLGVARRVRRRPPRAWRIIPLVAGLGELAYFVGRAPHDTAGQTRAFLSGFMLVMFGVVLAGPWLTMVGSRLLAIRAGRPANLIAGRRLADDPRAAFRAISGLVLALFVTSVATGVITTAAMRNTSGNRTAAAQVVTAQFGPNGGGQSVPYPAVDTVPDLSEMAGVRNVTVVHPNPAVPADAPADDPGLVLCADLAKAGPDYGSCPAGAEVAGVNPFLTWMATQTGRAPMWRAETISPDQVRGLGVMTILVRTDGSAAAIDRVTTALETAYPWAQDTSTETEQDSDTNRSLVAGWQQLADVVILTTIPIAGCGLAASLVGGLSERKRPFSLLRLTGVPLGVLRRVVVLETAVPLILASALAIGVGLWASDLFLRAQMGLRLHALPVNYWVFVAVGLVASLAIIGSTMPLLRRITGPETARNE